jgi:hypothetical protein
MTQNTKCESSGCIEVTDYDGFIRVRSGETGTVMQCTREEWHSFVADLIAGRWDDVGRDI